MEYKLTRRRGQKNIRIHLNDKGELLVSSPYFVSIKQIDSFVLSKTAWIENQRTKFVSHTYQQGDILPFFGKNLHLNIIGCTKPHIGIVDDQLFVFTKRTDSESIKRSIKRFYTHKLLDFCVSRVDFWAKQLLVRTPNLQINNAKSRWGVCYPTKNLVKISLISATLEPDLLDMIVLHETCHLIYCNHQVEFYNLMKKHMPDFEEKNTRFKLFTKSGVHRNLF